MRISGVGVSSRDVLILAPNLSAASFKAMRLMDESESVEQVVGMPLSGAESCDSYEVSTLRTDDPSLNAGEPELPTSPVPRDLPPLFPDAERRFQAAVQSICALHCPE